MEISAEVFRRGIVAKEVFNPSLKRCVIALEIPT